MNLLDIFINHAVFDKIGVSNAVITSSLWADFMYKGVKLHMSVTNRNQVFISYSESLSTIIQNTCETVEDLEKLFELLDKLTLYKK